MAEDQADEVGARGAGRPVVWNHATPPRDWEAEFAKKSRMMHKTFRSQILGEDYGYMVLLLPNYESSPNERYPVSYYIHGIGGNEWTGLEVGLPAEEMMGAGKMPPMILVAANSPRGGERTEEVFMTELIPHIDAAYRTIAKRQSRVLSGFSMGGGRTASWGLTNLDSFCGLIMFAPALRGGGYATLLEENAHRLKNVKRTAASRTYLRLLVGADDGLLNGARQFQARAKELGVEIPLDVAPGIGHDPKGIIKVLTPEKVFGYFTEALSGVH